MAQEVKHEILNIFEVEPNQVTLFSNRGGTIIDIVKKSQHLYNTNNVYEFLDSKGEKIEIYVCDDKNPIVEIRNKSNKNRYNVIVDEIINPPVLQECLKVINREFDESFVYLGRSI